MVATMVAHLAVLDLETVGLMIWGLVGAMGAGVGAGLVAEAGVAAWEVEGSLALGKEGVGAGGSADLAVAAVSEASLNVFWSSTEEPTRSLIGEHIQGCPIDSGRSKRAYRGWRRVAQGRGW